MTPEYPYHECLNCEGIKGCPHPEVNIAGKPIPPEDCPKKEKIENT